MSELGEYEEPPKTFLRIIGQSQTEKAWHLLLAYFLDPSEPHGFGTDALQQFLRVVSENRETPFEYHLGELKSATVDVEVAADDGRPDIVLWVDGSWFVCIEVKVDSGESGNQTERYANSERLGDLDVTTIPESQQNYVYLADRRARGSNAREFVDIHWKDVVEGLDRLRSNQLATYPARSGSQLSEFLDHIKHELHMTEDTAAYTEKAVLAIEHQDLLEELDNAVGRVVEDIEASWDSELRKDPPAGWTDEWKTIRYSGKYGRILKEEWVLPSNTTGKPKKGKGFAIAFPTEILRENIENKQTHFKFKVYGGNEYSDRYQEHFYSNEFQERIGPILEKHDIIVEENGDNSRLLKTPYPLEIDSGTGYNDALKQAFQEHLELVPHLEDLYFEVRSEIDNEPELFE